MQRDRDKKSEVERETATETYRVEKSLYKINSTIIFKYLTADDENAEINLKPLMITNLLCGVLHI